MSIGIPAWPPPGKVEGSFVAGELGAEEPRPVPFAAGLLIRFVNSSLNSGTICHFIPLPGSSVRRGIFWKALFSDRLCRMEFCRQVNPRFYCRILVCFYVPASQMLNVYKTHISLESMCISYSGSVFPPH